MKNVMITGASGGIGEATAIVFAREGWQIIGVDREKPKTADLFDGFFLADLAEKHELKGVFTDISEQFDGLDAVINNAALQLCKPLLETTISEWDSVFSVNLRAVFLVMQESYSLIRKRRGSIVNIGSVHARATSKNIAAYAASKGGLEALTRAAALEFAADGVRVNGIHPGAVETEMLSAGLRRGLLEGVNTEELLKQLGNSHPLGRIGQPEEIGEACLFLADNRKSFFMTGEFLVVDGGALCRLSTES